MSIAQEASWLLTVSPAPRPPSRAEIARCTFELLAGRWNAPVAYTLADAPRRFNELRRHKALRGISAKVLTATLRSMQRDGLVEREDESRNARYQLTGLGEGLLEATGELVCWGERFLALVDMARANFDELDGEELEL